MFVHAFPISLVDGDRLRDDNFGENRNVFIMAYQGGGNFDERIRRICGAYAEGEVLDINVSHFQ